MIAAAAAAMIGGVQAATATYNFVAYLTSTDSASSENYTTYGAWTEYTFKDNGAIMWFDDTDLDKYSRKISNQYGTTSRAWLDTPVDGGEQAVLDNYKARLQWGQHDLGGGDKVPALEVLAGTEGTFDVTEASFLLIQRLADTYTHGAVCGSITVRTKNDVNGQCYRVPAADSITATLTLDPNDCCRIRQGVRRFFNDANGVPSIDYGFEERNYDMGAWGGFFNRFGGPAAESSPYLEIYAKVRNLFTMDRPDNRGELTRGHREFRGYIAGQGSHQPVVCSDNAAVSYDVPVQISGNIVGSALPEVCGCCRITLPRAIAFDCLYSTTDPADPGLQTLNTAAFGSFYLVLTDLTNL